MGSNGPERKAETGSVDSLESFLHDELARIRSTIQIPDGGWLKWKGALEKAKSYTDEQVLAIFEQTSTRPLDVADPEDAYPGGVIPTRTYSPIDDIEIPVNETFPDMLRRIVARVVKFELAYPDGIKRENPAKELSEEPNTIAGFQIEDNLYKLRIEQGMSPEEAAESAERDTRRTLEYGSEDWTF